MRITLFIKNLFSWLIIAFTTLTRLPFPFTRFISYDERNITNSTIFFPLVGLFYGVLLFVAARILSFMQIPLLLFCFILQILPYSLNKFLHFDGLCDVMDAFWSDRSKEQRLKILKDSRLGSFAIGGIIFFLLLKFILIYLFLKAGIDFGYLLFIPVFSRYGMVILSYKSKYPRAHGTGIFIIGKISTKVLLASSLMFLLTVAGIMLLRDINTNDILVLLSMAIASFAFIMLFKFYSYRKIGGVTGDVLGASSEIMELVIFITYLLLSWGHF